MPDLSAQRYVGEAMDNGRPAKTWHIDPNCGAMAGRAVTVLTVERMTAIEAQSGRMMRPCRLCNR